MKNIIFIFAISALTCNLTAFASGFVSCKSTYALCTTALCKPVPGKKDEVSCKCSVRTGYSAGTGMCQKIKNTSHGQLIYSRYYPIKSYVTCANNRPWAWCLDKPCLIDKKHPGTANCMCSVVSGQQPYIIVTNAYTATTCHKGLYSSATVDQANQVTEFLKTQPEPKPYTIKVLH